MGASVVSSVRSYNNVPKYMYWFCLFLFAVGLISRLAPLLNIDGRLLQQFVTEDGYLMLTIARNVALGFGMSTSEGTIPTNGTQPFVTFIWSLGYLLTGADKVYGVVFAHVVQVIVSCLASFFLYKLALRVFDYSHSRNSISLLLAALFFASPNIIPHSMNFLETGTYLLAIILVIYAFYETDDEAEQTFGIRKSLWVGFLLGWMFWVRIDSVFIILAACVSYLFRGIGLETRNLLQRFYNTLVFGTLSVLVAAPWLLNNYFRFGSLTPISGQAQAGKHIGQNMDVVPSILVEYISIVLPIPKALQSNFYIVVVSSVLCVAALFILIFMFRRSSIRNRTLILMGTISATCYVGYYGLFFGAEHFMARYIGALAPFLALFFAGCILFIYERIFAESTKPVIAFSAVVLILVVALNGRIYKNGVPHQHFQVTGWVQANVPPETWIGATQTGTLGYFHDRTINLDGKVNPEALAARQGKKYCPEVSEGTVQRSRDCLMNYIVQRELWYLVDWEGIVGWIDIPPLSEYFTVEVDDKKRNLGVLKRIGAPELKPN